MRFRHKLGFIAAAAAVVAGVGTTPAPAGPAVPAVPAPPELSGAITGVHDPTMVRDGDTWYLFSTNDGMAIRRSTDLSHWEVAGRVFPDGLPAWAYEEIPELAGDRTLGWAPDISRVGDRWHLYWAVAVFGTPNAVIGLMSNATLDPADPDYEWVDEGMVVRSHPGDPYVAIDGNAVTDEDGARWLVYGSFWDGIVLRPLDPDTGKLVPGGAQHNLARRDPWWLGVEGAYVVQRDGWWYLFASFGFCCQGVRSTYSTHVGRSRSLTGPYVDAAGQPMLDNGGTTVIGRHGDVIGPGHGSVIQDGEDWMYVHHYYDRANAGVPTLSIRPILWSDDGWPVAADPGFQPATAPANDEVAGRWHLSGYPEECSARPPDDITIELRPDGTVQPAGTWRVVDDRVEVDTTERDWWWFVDPAQGTGFGRDQRTAAIRAERLGAAAPLGGTLGTDATCNPTPAQPPVPPGTRVPPDEVAPAVPVRAQPRVTG